MESVAFEKTCEQKSKARRSREADKISELEIMDNMIGSVLFERENIEFGISVRRPESTRYDALLDHNSNSHSNSN